MGKRQDFLNALVSVAKKYPNYYNSSTNTGIGCSDYMRLALCQGGVITQAEANDVQSLWAVKGYKKVLEDTTRFQKLSASTKPIAGDILWYEYHHVAASNGGSAVFEAAPHLTSSGQVSHPLCDYGTEVGLYSSHAYNCSGGNLTCIYRIIEDGASDSTETESTSTSICTLPVLTSGTKGDAVKALQAVLNVRIGAGLSVDGSFGPATLSAVKKFQTQNSLTVDGSVGPATWKALL